MSPLLQENRFTFRVTPVYTMRYLDQVIKGYHIMNSGDNTIYTTEAQARAKWLECWENGNRDAKIGYIYDDD
jgi:hypothetical protein